MKASKKLIGAIAALTVAASLTVGTTFAWFSSQSSVSTDEIQLGVTSGSDTLQVAVIKASDSDVSKAVFKYNVSKTDMEAAMGTVAFDALTSKDGGKGIENKAGDVVSYDASTGTNKYAMFDLVFRTNKAGASLVLASGAAITPEGDGYKEIWADKADSAEYGTAINAAGEINARAAHASRVAFVNDTAAKVWAPYEKLEIAEAQTSDVAAGYYEKNLASDYNQMKNGAITDTVQAVTYTNRIYRAPATGAANSNNVIAVFPTEDDNSDGFYEMRITVKIWLEGTDGDCLDTVLKDKFKVKFDFRIEDIASE